MIICYVRYNTEIVPVYVAEYKRKVNAQVCDNHRDISFFAIAGIILAKVLLNRLNVQPDQARILPESQCGFKKDRGTIEIIKTARQLQEKCGPLHDICRPYQSN